MKAFIVIFLVLALQHSYGFQVKNPKASDDELIAAAVLYTEGDRTPSSSFPNDPFFNLSSFPRGFGQLTEKGMMRHYELGRWFRSRYSSFLSEEYNASEIYVLSTDTDRTLMSAEANLAGLYPPKGSQIWNQLILWQPVPVHTQPTNQDQVLYMERPCPKYNRLYNEVYNSDYFQDINEEYADFYEEVSNLTGWEVNDINYIYRLQTLLSIYSSYDPSYLPSWSSTLDQDKLKYLSGLHLARYTFTTNLQILGVSPFFYNLFTGFDNVLDETQESPKFLMFSAHPSIISSVLNSIGLFDYHVPEFASTLIWEMKINKYYQFYINMFYKRNSTDILEELKFPICHTDCDYDMFKSMLSLLTMDLPTWDIECAENNN